MIAISHPAPNPIELQEFQFKLLSRLRIFPEESPISLSDNLSLVCSASKYGLIFVGCPTGFQVLQTSKIIELQESKVKSRDELLEYPRREISLPSQPTHLGVSCDGLFLAVIFSTESCHIVRIYFVPSFFSQSIRVLHEVRATSDLNIQVSGICWNPGVSNLLALCFSDGSICVYEFKDTTFVVNSAPAEARANCLCWSPKGKQIVVGSSDGTLTQYKPELKAVKQLPAPVLNHHPVSVVSVQWMSNYQFAVVYRDTVDLHERPALIFVNAPKTGPQTYINYEDICYSTGNLRPPQFYLEHIQQWRVLIVGASTSIEVGVLGSCGSDEWQQWVQEDASRADLPLTKSHQETFPVGLAIDTSVQYCLPFGENQKFPPMPILCLYSHDGLLCMFIVVNSLENAEQICAPPLIPPDQSGLSLFTNGVSAIKVAPTPEYNQAGNAAPVAVSQVPSFQPTPQVASVAPLSMPVTSSFQTSFLPETPASQPSWMASSTPLNKFEYKGPENTGIESISPPHGGVQVTPVSGLGAMSLFGGSGGGLQFQKTPPQDQQQQPPPQTLQQLQQTPPKQQTPSNFAFNPVAPGGGSNMSFFSGNTGNIGINLGFGKGLAQTGSSSNLQMPSNTSPAPVSVPNYHSPQINQPPVSAPITPPVSVPAVVQPVPSPASALAQSEVPAADNIQESIMMREEVVNAAIIEEVAHFDAELKEVLNSFKNMDIKTGDNPEKAGMNSTLESLNIFWGEVKETTTDLKGEVDLLKNSMLETFCYVEDAKARNFQCQNPGYKKLVYTQELDPVNKRRLNNINQHIFYINSQIKEADRVIDDRWLSNQEKKKSSKGTLRIPPREELYQTMVVQNNLINKYRIAMVDIQQNVKERNHKMESSAPLITNLHIKKNSRFNKGDVELSKLAENLLQVKLNEREFSTLNTSVKEDSSRVEESESKENYMVTEEKKNLLRQIHSEVLTSIPKVRVPRPFLILKQSSVTSYTPTPRVSVSNDHMTPGERLLQKYLKSGLCKTSTSESKLFSESVVKTPELSRSETAALASGKVNTETSSDLFVDRNPQKDIVKPVFNQKVDLVKPVVIQNQSNILNLKKDTIQFDPSNKENIPLSSSVTSFNTEKTVTGFGVVKETEKVSAGFKTPDKQSFVPASSPVVPNLEGIITNKEQQKTTPPPPSTPLVSINKIVSSIGESSDAKVTSSPLETSQPSLFSNFGNAQTPPSGLFSNFSSNATFQSKGSNQEQSKPQTIFGDAFNKSQAAAKQSADASTLINVGFSSTGFLKGDSLPSSSSSTSTIGSSSSFSFASQDSSQNKPGSVFGGKLSTSTSLNFEFGKNLDVGSPNQSQISEEVSKSDTAVSVVKETAPDQSVQVSKVGSIFGGGAVSTPTNAFTFGSGKNLFGGNVSTTSAGLTSFTFGSNSTSIAATSETPKAASSSTFQLNFGSTTLNSSASTPSFGGIFTPSTTAASSESSVITSSTSIQSFSFTSSWANSTGKQPNFGSDNSSNNNASITPPVTASQQSATLAAPAITSISTPINLADSDLTTSAVVKPVVTCAPVATSELSASGNLTPASVPGATAALTPASPSSPSNNNQSTSVVPEATTLPVVSSSTTLIFPPPPTPAVSVSSSSMGVTSRATSGSNETSSATSIASKVTSSSSETSSNASIAASTFSFGKLAVSLSDDSSTPTVTSTPTDFSFAQILPSSTADSGAKMPLAFGQSSPSLGTSLFGGNASSMSASQTTNLFGQAAQPTAASTQPSSQFTFSLPPESTQQPPSSTTTSFFGSKSFFGSTTATTTTTASFFGQSVGTPASTSATSIFGQSLATSNQSSFGQVSSAQPSGFGTPAFGSKPTFGQSGGSLFGQNTSGGFGAGTTPVFGGASLFGGSPSTPDNAAQAGGLFQSPGSGGGLLGARTNIGGNPGGSFSTGGQTISQTGFGTPAFQNKPSSGFGSSSTFGSSPSFGGAPTFGGSPTFGNPGKVFGSSSPTNTGFGSGTQQSTTFENLANQNTMSFGNLAQNQTQATFGGGGGSLFGAAAQGTPSQPPPTSFPPPTFGGNSFSSWR